MIRQIEEIPKTPNQVDRMKKAMEDIQEIIQKRMEKSEIIDPAYSESSLYEGYKRAIRKVVMEKAKKAGMGYVPAWASFQVIHREIDGKRRWFILFDVQQWDMAWYMAGAKKEGKA